MVSQENCAFYRNDGYCLMHKARCCYRDSGCCPDGVKRAHPQKDAYCWIRQTYDRHTAKGRMQFYTRDVSGGIVFSQCTGKTRYPNWKRATEVLRLRMRNGSMPLRVYHCQFCGGYHLTHKLRHEQDISNAA